MRKQLLIISLITGLGCGPKSDDAGQTPAELLEAGCASFCDRALSCPSSRFAESWDFQDQVTCEEKCITFSENFSEPYPDKNCHEIFAAEWSCAGEIESCVEFDAFEDSAFGDATPVPNPCRDELYKALDNCN